MTRIEANPSNVETAEAAPVNPEASANGNQPAKTHKGPPKKEDHPEVAAGNLKAIPASYDPKKHVALAEENFDPTCLNVFFSYKAARLQEQADVWKRRAEDFKRLGAIKDKKTAQKVFDMADQMRKSVQMLIDQGEPMENFDQKMLKALGFDVPEVAETAAA